MRVLAIETSTLLGGVAVMEGTQSPVPGETRDTLVVETRVNVEAGPKGRQVHSERLMPEIDRALSISGLSLSDIDVLAVSIGPGSFTGLRIGLSAVKGLAYATGLPVVAVPTLEAMAWNFPHSRLPVMPMLDARKKEVYAGLFGWEGEGFIRLLSERSANPVDFTWAGLADIARPADPAEPANKFGEKILLTGEGSVLYRKTLEEALGGRAVFAPAHLCAPLPSSVALLGLRKALKGEFSEPVSLRPFYIRKSEAEVKKTK